jgi:hypothetical protein
MIIQLEATLTALKLFCGNADKRIPVSKEFKLTDFLFSTNKTKDIYLEEHGELIYNTKFEQII